MKTFRYAALAAAFALTTGAAFAQSGSDEARALAAQATAAHELDALSRRPQVDPVAPGDYRAQAQEHSRVAQWDARRQAIRDYAAGLRSRPIAARSEDSARAEAQRANAEQGLASQAAALKATLASQ